MVQSIKLSDYLSDHWKKLMETELESEYFQRIEDFLINEKSKGIVVYPPVNEIFTALNLVLLSEIKVVIIGQDPYHGESQAHGLCFSVKYGIEPPPSLVNIFKEIKSNTGISIPQHGELTYWAKQGVLLLNAVLTVRANQAGSHQKIGWQIFTDAIISLISKQTNGIVFLLWGKYAESKCNLIDDDKHYILKSPHPSPLSAFAGFFGCKHFSKTNEILKSLRKTPIDWSLPIN